MLHVHDDAVGDDEEERVILIVLCLLQLPLHTISIYKIQQWLKVGWSGKRAMLNRILVGFHDSLDTRHLWSRDVSVQGKTMADFFLSR